jgi:hypothetical protein
LQFGFSAVNNRSIQFQQKGGKTMRRILLLAAGLLFLGACEAEETVKEDDYETFKDKVNEESFTGFVYLGEKWEMEQAEYIPMIAEVFQETGAVLYYGDLNSMENVTREKFSGDRIDPDIYLPVNRLAYIKEGEVVSEWGAREGRDPEEVEEQIRHFIDKYSSGNYDHKKE